MSDFLKAELDKLSGETTEEQTTQEQEETQTEETQQKEQTTTETETQTEQPEEKTKPEPKKLELDLLDFLKTNQDTVLKVLTEKDKDYSSLSNEEALRLKLEKENPEWSKQDVEAELQDKYGVGLEKIQIDEDVMDEQEIKDAKAHNKHVDATIRSLKKEGKTAKDYLASLTKDLELPKYSFEFEPEEQVKPEEIFAQYQQALSEQAQKQKEEQWIPDLKKAFESVDSIKEEIKYIDNENEVVLNVDYKLSEAEKTEIQAQLADYVGQPSDEKFIKDGVVDVQGFVQEKSEEILRKKIYKTIAKEAAANARKEFVKKNVVNYTEEARTTVHTEHDDDNFESFMLNKKKK